MPGPRAPCAGGDSSTLGPASALDEGPRLKKGFRTLVGTLSPDETSAETICPAKEQPLGLAADPVERPTRSPGPATNRVLTFFPCIASGARAGGDPPSGAAGSRAGGFG